MIAHTNLQETARPIWPTSSSRQILRFGVLTAVMVCLYPHDVAARPGWGNCTECHGPALSTTPADGSTLDFGNVLVGDSVDKTLRITNTGGNRGGRSIPLSGDFPASAGDFSLNGQTHFSNLARNASVDRSYTFGPSTRGTHSRDMTATADESPDGWPVSQGTSTVSFTGRGVASIADVDSAEADAGPVRIGDNGSARFVVQNLGDGNLSGRGPDSNLQGSVSEGSGAFVGPSGSVDLMDGANMDFQYSFVPTDRGAQSTAIEISFANGSPDGANQAHTVNVQLQGIGVGPEFSSSPEPDSLIDFGEIGSGETSTQSLLVSNPTADGDLGDLTNLTLLSAAISGPNADWFSIDSFVPGTILAAAESLNFDLLFNSQGQSGPFQASLMITTDQGAQLGASGNVFSYSMTGSALGTGLPGDYNENGELDVGDIELQTAELQKIPADQNLAVFDHNGDGVVDVGQAGPNRTKWGDRLIWIRDLAMTSVGDSNFDGIFNSGDLVDVFGAAKYDAGMVATWEQGDWNGDMRFNSSDLVFAFQDGGYSPESVAAASAVPEPTSMVMLLVCLIGILIGRRDPAL